MNKFSMLYEHLRDAKLRARPDQFEQLREVGEMLDALVALARATIDEHKAQDLVAQAMRYPDEPDAVMRMVRKSATTDAAYAAQRRAEATIQLGRVLLSENNPRNTYNPAKH